MTAVQTFALPGLSERFDRLTNDDALLRDSMTSRMSAVEGLDALPRWAAAAKLHDHLRNVFVPDAESLAVAQRILETGLGYAIHAYPDLGHYIRVSCSDSYSPEPEPPTWILTGLAGVSKTATMKALDRVLSPELTFQASMHTPLRQLRGGVFLSVQGKATNKTMNSQLRKQLGLPESGSARDSDRDRNEIRRELYRQGALFMVLDESQAVANGAVAGAAFVNLIAYLRSFGVPVIVVGNYSMCHGILAQHSQNRQRLVAESFTMHQDLAGDPDYEAHLQAYVDACGGMLDIKPSHDAIRVCELTGGGSRALLKLVCIAYVDVRSAARQGGSVTVDLSSLERAYGSSGYSDFRDEIEELRKFALSPGQLRKDLRNPFVSIGEAAMSAKRGSEKLYAAQIAREKLLASLSVAEIRKIASGEMDAPQFLPSPPRPGESAAPLLEPIRKAAPVRSKGARRPPPTFQDAMRTRDAF